MGASPQHIHGRGAVIRPIASKAGRRSLKDNAPLALSVDERSPPVRTGTKEPLGSLDITPRQPSGIQPLTHHNSHDGNSNTNAIQANQPPLFPTEGSYEDDGISSHESTNWEYHGPRSCLSLCSQSGIEWVESRSGIRGFRSSAQKFTNDITRRLKLSSRLSVRRVPDPDRATAWRYTSAYFQHALDASMGVVQQSTFESQLTAYLDGVTSHVDIAWHALRNAIYASGCRIHLSETQSFHEANRLAWTYFENALALHTEILLFRTSLASVQALTVMAYYSQNFGSPCLEYMLCNNALALAFGRGLHRKPTPGWNLTAGERSHRSCVFWALYCLEKQIEKQSGRPSIINDDEVTCELPGPSSSDRSVNLTYVTLLIELARFASVVTRRLSTVQVLCLGAEALVKSVVELDEQMNTLRLGLEPTITLGAPLNPNRLPPGITLQQTIYLHCLYNTTVLDIHNTLMSPWSKSLLSLTPRQVLRSQVQTSIETVLRTCHTAMLTLHYVHIDASTPVPLSFFTPIYVLTNLFICVLQNPAHDRVTAAISLMELGAAFFTRLHIASDAEVPMEFAKELTALARETSQKFLNMSPRSENSTTYGSAFPSPFTAAELPYNYAPTFQDMIGREALELEQWSMLIPADMDLDGIALATAM